MLSSEDNKLLTDTGRGTPCGELMRRYWQPAALSEELPPGGAPVPARLLGEDLVLYRDDDGRPALIALCCPHRGADLSYGRIEDGGLRCIYHGWLFDRSGRCLEQPGEPAGSDYYRKIRQTAYPCTEAGGIIFAYLGPGEAPLLPAYEFLVAPERRRLVGKAFHDCNYLQGNEGNIDPVHLSFLHRTFAEGNGRSGVALVPGGAESSQTFFARDVAPAIVVEETEFGLRIFAVRQVADTLAYLRISNFILPNLAAFPGSGAGNGYSVNWHVPIDDTTHWKYTITFSRVGQLDRGRRQGQRAEVAPDYRLVRNQANRYLQERGGMKDRTFAGLGPSYLVQDACVTVGMGPIQDRTQEHLGATDIAVIAARQRLLRAIRAVAAGKDAPHVVRDPEANRFALLGALDTVVSASEDWRTAWREQELADRATLGVV